MKEQVYYSIFKSWIPPSQPILASPPPPYGLHPTLKWKKMPTPLKKIFENQKVPPHSLAGKDTIIFLLYCWKTTLTLMPVQTLLAPITMEPVFWSYNLLLRITQVSTFQKLTLLQNVSLKSKRLSSLPQEYINAKKLFAEKSTSTTKSKLN